MTGLAVRCAGMVTSVGFNAPASCAALRAGIREVSRTNLWDPETGTYLSAGKVGLPQWWVGVGKLADLVAPAIQECLAATPSIPPEEIPVLLGVAPASRPFRLQDIDSELLPEIARRLGFRLHRASRLIPRDHVSAAVALREADDLITRRHVPGVIVAGVDSLLHHDLKNYYLSKRRLLTPDNSNGFSLGEAGSAVLVGSAAASDDADLVVAGVGVSTETATIEGEDPLRGEALTQAIRSAFAEGQVTYQDLQYRISDLNGEHYKFKEMVLAMMRLERKPKPKLFELWHPIEYLGDVGAAIGPIVLGVALDALKKGYGPGPGVLCTFGNDDGERAALVLTQKAALRAGVEHPTTVPGLAG
jgi:3-oxoacyl-[acyl-carrier-protein] synthase I